MFSGCIERGQWHEMSLKERVSEVSSGCGGRG